MLRLQSPNQGRFSEPLSLTDMLPAAVFCGCCRGCLGVISCWHMQDTIDHSTAPDTSGPVLTEEVVLWITVHDATLLFSEAGIPRNKRSIRRYCERGDLECKKTENALHQPQYFIDAASVAVYIEQQRTLMTSNADVSGAVLTEPDNAGHDHGSDAGEQNIVDTQNPSGDARTLPDTSGLAAGPNTMVFWPISLNNGCATKMRRLRFCAVNFCIGAPLTQLCMM